MNYKAIIFDLDGTLVNSIQDIADAMNTVLKKRHYPTHNYETYKLFVGSGIRSLVINALPNKNPNEAEVDECLSEMMRVYSNHCTIKTHAYNGILELLDILNSKNLKLNIFSNKDETLTKKVANAILPKYFHQVLGLTTEALKKPNPAKALNLINNLGLKPEEVIFVGDSNIDIQTAKNANMLAVGVSWGFRDKQELTNEGADYILDKPIELLDIL
ncbi:HAD family hydrolase [Seonamhaeicola sp. S2-3]|uniref:HAD family hydrolase n=1 Tax=Seonamhaeicola sp. S2-3 TaxID=1936081 RepID=UPI000972BBBA|nr:HAD family hydrolase [Seonamhaeicola sp. S2-3]APY09908.1 HAD family hydrolase [Seonamhaeicola sp. S2-3]